MKKFIALTTTALCLTAVSTTAISASFVMQKRNTSFSIDGGGGSANGRQVYLWNTNTSNVNQQWGETTRDSKYKQYKKVGTNRCLDGGNGASRNQKVILWDCSNGNRNQHWEKKSQANSHFRLKKRSYSFSMDGGGGAKRRQGIKLWNSSDSNVNQHWKFLTPGGSTSSSSSSSTSSTSSTSTSSGFSLSSSREPWQNFDLTDWALDTPARDSSDGLSLRTTDKNFADGNVQSAQDEFFFTHSDGGMRFKSTIGGAKTSSGTSFTRSELREMLRKGNTSISTTGTTKNNWQMGYASTNNNLAAKGGKLTATLRVNRVTTQADTNSQHGRVIVGQIHAAKNEPIRLYYRKLKNNSKGSIYFAHETRGGSETYYEIIGSRSSSQSNPSNGISLNELWSYEINQSGSTIQVVIRRGDSNGSIIANRTINMGSCNGCLNSGYNVSSEWMYFKAGAYTQNNTGSSSDHDIVTFYRLANTH